ncbi:hypothetical protein HT594_00094 [Phenacoccus solenopsis nudivirus]|nr:hypothetical protein HT594_00094 [Phenacoccus solenopsis nudivirus]
MFERRLVVSSLIVCLKNKYRIYNDIVFFMFIPYLIFFQFALTLFGEIYDEETGIVMWKLGK